jgi:hypothetical protein
MWFGFNNQSMYVVNFKSGSVCLKNQTMKNTTSIYIYIVYIEEKQEVYYN